MRYIWWLVVSQPWRVLRGSLIGTAWMIGLAVRPYLVARAIDDGLRAHDNGALLGWSVAIVVAGIGLAWLGIMRHRTMTFVREDATARSAGVLLRQLARIGAVLPRKLATGEVATVGGSDISHVSQVLTMTGPGVGAVLAYAVVAVVLWWVSPVLAVVVVLGVPAIALLVGPLLRRLERAESVYRQQQGELTTRAGDIVAGLRVLAGVGGRDLFGRRYAGRSQELLAKGYRVGSVNSWIDALTVVIPGLFLAIVVWLAARMAAAGDITVGELVAVYGYVATLIVPVWFLLGGAYDIIRGRVAAHRIIALLTLVPDVVGRHEGIAPGPAGPADLHDPASGLRVRAGQLLGVATGEPAEAAALADRLGRFVVSDVTWGGVPLGEIALDQVRARILVADHDSYLFAGELRDMLRTRTDSGPAEVAAALHAASAQDVVEALPDGLASPIGARARTLSGGERQRIRLARALLAEPDVLILLDPTSAVDAHTEARIAERLRRARAGRTTVVLTSSPLLLSRVDAVAFLPDGRVSAVDRHTELLQHHPDYRALVSRDTEAEGATR
jgi:ABC-type multidrug transport system fused ATPase/permease subunit